MPDPPGLVGIPDKLTPAKLKLLVSVESLPDTLDAAPLTLPRALLKVELLDACDANKDDAEVSALKAVLSPDPDEIAARTAVIAIEMACP
jgi:hypothetical protein